MPSGTATQPRLGVLSFDTPAAGCRRRCAGLPRVISPDTREVAGRTQPRPSSSDKVPSGRAPTRNAAGDRPIAAETFVTKRRAAPHVGAVHEPAQAPSGRPLSRHARRLSRRRELAMPVGLAGSGCRAAASWRPSRGSGGDREHRHGGERPLDMPLGVDQPGESSWASITTVLSSPVGAGRSCHDHRRSRTRDESAGDVSNFRLPSTA
jgi:hypothetical protein